MNKSVTPFLVILLSCSHPSEHGKSSGAVLAPDNSGGDQGHGDETKQPQQITVGEAPEAGSPESAEQIKVSCEEDMECVVIASYCKGYTSVNKASVVMARTHYDAIAQMKSCRKGGVSPRPEPYCDNKHCEPTVWNEGYSIHFAQSIDFQDKKQFDGQSLTPFATTDQDKGFALEALRTKLAIKHPDILALSSSYRAQYMGATSKAHKNPILLGNFFCRAGAVDWRREWIVVDDGGSCYFQFKFDLTTRKLIELTVNGNG